MTREETMEFWTSERRGAVEIATFSNPPHNYIGKPQLDELAQLVAQWRDPSIRAVVIQSRTGENSGFTQYSVEELYGMASHPALSRYAGAAPRGFAWPLGLAREGGDHAPPGGGGLGEKTPIHPPMSVANAKRALYLGADSNLQAAYEVENMNWTEVMQSDDAKVALKTFLD